MSIGPLGIASSVAGGQLANRTAELDRAQQEAGNQDRRISSETKANDAAGLAATDGEDTQTEERDADGRRLWERPSQPSRASQTTDPAEAPRQSKDPAGARGNQLDLTG
jgi:hypothetical protein